LLDEVKNTDIERERTLLVGLYGPDTIRVQAEEYLDELELLTDTAGGITVEKMLQNRTHPDPSSYVGSGKLREIKHLVGERNIETIIFDDDLSPTQIRNVEKQTKTKVLDRSGLILDIFASRAKTAAAKTQVELAQLQYLLPRLTRFWTHLSRQKGGIGTKGPGETQIETDRRLIGKRISNLKDKLDKLDRQRTTQRKGRSKMNTVALVGYTNAGKSTLMNALTDTGVLAEDQLFATLDSTVRRVEVGQHDILLSDTVGFIRKLPHNLIESFKSTLDEVRESDILLHVIDASAFMLEEYIEVVDDTLEELDIENDKTIMIFNKVDKIDAQRLKGLKADYPDAIFISAARGIGIKSLQDSIVDLIERDYVYRQMRLPVKHYKAVSYLHNVAHVDKEEYEGNDVIISFTIAPKHLQKLQQMIDGIDYELSVV
jgi:GTP-binding protein HflX